MALFASKFVTYLLIFIGVIAIGLVGGFIGVQLRKAKDKHDASKKVVETTGDEAQ